MQHRERDILLGAEKPKTPFGSKGAHMVYEQPQLVREGEAQLNFVRHQVESDDSRISPTGT